MRTILKVVYFMFAAILALVVYLFTYNSAGYDHVKALSDAAISEKNYSDLGKIFGGCLDTRSIIEDTSDYLDMVIYPSSTLTSVSYTENEESKSFNKYEDSYYIYIINPTFDYDDVSVNGNVINKTAIRFESDTNSYDYYLKITDSINSEIYVESPSTLNEAVMKNNRDYTVDYASWNFFKIVITESMLNAMNIGEVKSVSIIDSDGENIYTISADMNFTQEYFTFVEPLTIEYNKYLSVVELDDEEKLAAADEIFNLFYFGENGNDGFESLVNNSEFYSFRYTDDYLQPSSLIWRSIGMVLFFAVAVMLLYALLFHFKQLKALISGEARKSRNKYNPAPRPKQK